MIILIGGVSLSGKTLMAQKLLEKYRIPYLSIDHVKMGLIRGSRYCDFKATDGDEKITEKLWPIVKGIIMTNIENQQHNIIEGCYLPPESVKDFEPEYLDKIISLYIGFSEDYIDNNFHSGIISKRSVIEQRMYDAEMDPQLLKREHLKMKKACEKHGATYFEISHDYEKEIEDVYSWIDEEIGKMQST